MPNRPFFTLASLVVLGLAGRAAPLLAQITPTNATNAPGTYSVGLNWTAPGDDGTRGTATLYDVRYSTRPITESNFALAAHGMLFSASPAGTHESCRVGNLFPGTDYYFAVKTMDENGNWSALSNVVYRSGRQVEIEPIDLAIPFSLGNALPNPARSSVQFSLTVPQSRQSARIEIFDAAGRRVRGYSVEGAANHPLVWDLRNDRGDHVSAGMYILRAQHANQTYLRRFAVVQ